MSSVLKKYDLSIRDSIQLSRSPISSSHQPVKSDQVLYTSPSQQINQNQKPEAEPPLPRKPYHRFLDHIIIAATLFEAISYLINGIIFDLTESYIAGFIGFFTLILVCVHFIASRKRAQQNSKKFQALVACLIIATWATSLVNARADSDLNLFLFVPILAFKTLLLIHYSISFILILAMLGMITIAGIVTNILLNHKGTAFDYADGVVFCIFAIPFILNLSKPEKKVEKSTIPPPPPQPQFDEKIFNAFHILDEAVVIVDMLGHPVYSNTSFDKMFPYQQREEDILASTRDLGPQQRQSLTAEFHKISGLKAKEPELHNRIADALKTDATFTPRQSDSMMKRVLRSTGSPDSLLVLDRESGLSGLYVTFLNSERQLKNCDIGFNSESRLPKFESFTGVLRRGLKDSVDIEMNMGYLEVLDKNYMCLVFHMNHYQAELKAAQKESDFRKQMLRYVAHDMRNPLASSQLLLEAAEGDLEITSKLKEAYIKPCLKSLKFLFALVNDLVDAAQLAAGKFKLVIVEVILADVIDEVIKLFEMKAKAKDITLNKVLDPRLPLTMFTDSARLTQILINLMSNALKYTPRKGAITVKVDPNILNANKIDFSVEDNGIGIRMEDQKDLLKDFGRVEGAKDKEDNPYGVGLGLSISNKLAAQLNVEGLQEGIRIDSIVGKGTKMKFSVENRKAESISRTPSAAKVEGLSDPSKKVSENYSSSLEESRVGSSLEIRPLPGRVKSAPKVKKTLSFLRKIHEEDVLPKQLETHGKAFIIDDDAFSAESLALLLRSMGVSTDKAYSTKDALKKLVAVKDPNTGVQFGYDVLFVDGMMDDMDGFESCKLLKEKMKNGEIKDAPIVFCTGLDAESEAQAREAGASFYATKPINRVVLTDILKGLKIGNAPNSATLP